MINSMICFKWVIDEKGIIIGKSNKLNLENAEYKISDNDRSAIEGAMHIKEQCGGSVKAITVSSSSSRISIKDVLSRGPESVYFVNASEIGNLDPSQTSAILTKVIKDLSIDLIFCGVGSDDLYAQQVGPELAERLGIACITYVTELQIVEEEQRIIAKRRLDNEVEVVSTRLPALVTVLPEINEPRIPGLKDILDAGQKEVIEIDANELLKDFNSPLQTIDVVATNMERKCLKFGSKQSDIRKVVNKILQDGRVV